MTRTTYYFIIIVILFCSCSFGFGGTIDPNTSDTEYLAYAKHFDYVGYIEGVSVNSESYSASCVAIDDHHILTAAHIIYNSELSEVQFGSKKFKIKKFIIPKEFKYDHSGRADIAIGYSLAPLNLRFYPELYENSNEIGKVCCICGYGKTGTFNSGAVLFDKQKRAGSNIIDDIKADLLICSPSQVSSDNQTLRTSLEILIAVGDSGGGLFIDGKLAGINSCVLSDTKVATSSYQDISGHTRISKFAHWIQSNKIHKK